jgi:hypothetical protein
LSNDIQPTWLFKGIIALVTDASWGLEQAIALALGVAGADAAVTDLLIEGAVYNRSDLLMF